MKGKLHYAWIVVFVLSILCLVVLHQHLVQHDLSTQSPLTSSTTTTASSSTATAAKVEVKIEKAHVVEEVSRVVPSDRKEGSNCKHAIVLQQSPVLPSQQLDRLHAIDKSWAQWLASYPTSCLIAVLPCNTLSNMPSNTSEPGMPRFRWIQAMALSTKQCQPKDVNPYRNLAETFLRLLITYPQVEVITLANDHSFFLIPNWHKFMTTSLPVEVLDRGMLYSGNHLALQSGSGNRPIEIQHFASGGGGILLSRNILEIMMLTWTVLSNDVFLQDTFLRQLAANNIITPSLQSQSIETYNFNYIKTSEEISSMIHTIIKRHKENLIPTNTQKSEDIRILLHGRQSLRIRYLTGSRYELIHQSPLSPFREPNPISMNDLQRRCYAQDLWSRINPGIVMVHCLFELFGLSFFDISQQHDASRNLIFERATPTLNLLDLKSKQPMKCDIFGEIFNVFGFVRTINREYDDWYIRAKEVLNMNVTETCYEASLSKEVFKYSIARQLASLHYIDKVECMLLYKLLTSKDDIQAVDLIEEWPKNGEELGPYTRKISSVEEAALLAKSLNVIKAALDS